MTTLHGLDLVQGDLMLIGEGCGLGSRRLKICHQSGLLQNSSGFLNGLLVLESSNVLPILEVIVGEEVETVVIGRATDGSTPALILIIVAADRRAASRRVNSLDTRWGKA
jgi:hypothetical protein